MHRSLADPPRFAVALEERGHIMLSEKLGAVVHIFVLEDDIIRVAVLPEGAWKMPRSWAIAPGLDDVPDEGRARGTPTQAGSYTFFITISYSCGLKSASDQQYSISVNQGTVAAPPPPAVSLSVSTASLPDANINQPYTSPGLSVSGGIARSTWGTASAIELMCPGVPVTACATIRPARSNTPAERSKDSRKMLVNEVSRSDWA